MERKGTDDTIPRRERERAKRREYARKESSTSKLLKFMHDKTKHRHTNRGFLKRGCCGGNTRQNGRERNLFGKTLSREEVGTECDILTTTNQFQLTI